MSMHIQPCACELETKLNRAFEIKWTHLCRLGFLTGRNQFLWGAFGKVVVSETAPEIPKFELSKRNDLICVWEGSVVATASSHLGHLENWLCQSRTQKIPILTISFGKLIFWYFPVLPDLAVARASGTQGVKKSYLGKIFKCSHGCSFPKDFTI